MEKFELYQWFIVQNPIMQALYAGLFTWALTAIGASLVFLFKSSNRKALDISLGFTGGVMIAASFWSLLSPSIDYVENTNKRNLNTAVEIYLNEKDITLNQEKGENFEYIKMYENEREEYAEKNNIDFETSIPWIPPAIGFFLGALFLYGLDKIIPHLHIFAKREEAEGITTKWRKTILLVLAIALHNIPEGLAVGVAFGALASPELTGMPEVFSIGSAIALAIGIGIQNFPEGFAVSMPLRRQGVSRWKSWKWGQMSAIVEPIFAVIGAAVVMQVLPILPYSLAFAAGAMIFIVVEEVIPESQRGGHTDLATMGLILGFIVMMVLDVSLG
jgi:zinc transporter, ZIP family